MLLDFLVYIREPRVCFELSRSSAMMTVTQAKPVLLRERKRKRRDILGHRKGVSSKCQEESVETCIALKFSGAALSISGFLERLQKPLWKMSCQDIQ